MHCARARTAPLSTSSRQSCTTIYLRKTTGRTDVASEGVYESDTPEIYFCSCMSWSVRHSISTISRHRCKGQLNLVRFSFPMPQRFRAKLLFLILIGRGRKEFWNSDLTDGKSRGSTMRDTPASCRARSVSCSASLSRSDLFFPLFIQRLPRHLSRNRSSRHHVLQHV